MPGAGRDMKEPFLLKPPENLIPALLPQATQARLGGKAVRGIPEQEGLLG